MKMLLMPGKYHDVEGRWLRVLRLREKRTYRSQEVQDTYVKKTRDIWLLGPPQSGKSSAMQRLLAHSAQIWARWPVLSCLATDPLSRWCDQAPLQTVVDAQGRSYLSLKGEEKIDALLTWSTQHTWVLVLDDAHALSGRKLNLAVRLAQTARLVVMGAVSEQALHPSLRVCLQRRAPQVLLMSSEVPYDATLNLMWLILLLALAAGWWELAAALSTVRALGHGPLATRQR